VSELSDFGTIVLLVAAGFSLALASSKLTERFPLPGPSIFLLAAAFASDLFPTLAHHTSIRQVERIGVVALIAILFDGGMEVGWRRFRASAVEIASLGMLGTFATAAVGLLGAAVLLPLMRRSLPSEGLYPLRTLAAAGTIYGVAAVAHGRASSPSSSPGYSSATPARPIRRRSSASTAHSRA
jgi:NhaP-type Na+/H+ and K+/H+ antiporter